MNIFNVSRKRRHQFNGLIQEAKANKLTSKGKSLLSNLLANPEDGRSNQPSETNESTEKPEVIYESQLTSAGQKLLAGLLDRPSSGGGDEPSGSFSESSGGSGSDSSDEGSVISLGGTRTTFFKRRKMKGHSLQDMSDALRHRVVLALQEAGILDKDERLTKGVILRSQPAMKENTTLENELVKAALTKDGGSIKDWEKLKTDAVKLSSGQRVEVHFYKNKITGEVNYTHHDFKIKNPVSATITDGIKYKEGELNKLIYKRK